MSNRNHQNGYDDSNRAFLQAFMSCSTMTFEEARPILAAILTVRDGPTVLPEDITQDDLMAYIDAANGVISPLDLEIRNILRQTEVDTNDSTVSPPERVYALVNTTSDGLTQLATTYTADEIAFVKRVLDAMFERNNTRRSEAMVVSSMEATQLAKAPSADSQRRESGAATQQTQGGTAQSLSMTQAETVMRQLVDDGWVEKSRKGYYSLSPRGLMELRGWLVATYNDKDEGIHKIKFCAACRDIIIVGQRCENRDCLGRLHDHCTRNFFRIQKAEQCPVCRVPWRGDKFVGERALTSPSQTSRRSNNAVRSSQVGSSSQIEPNPLLDSLDENAMSE